MAEGIITGGEQMKGSWIIVILFILIATLMVDFFYHHFTDKCLYNIFYEFIKNLISGKII